MIWLGFAVGVLVSLLLIGIGGTWAILADREERRHSGRAVANGEPLWRREHPSG